uniref:Uncharacterized protein n=1 Tax=Rhizophora mucronata TaxID=61149 RepID=A0A2P2JQG3_RHIMU
MANSITRTTSSMTRTTRTTKKRRTITITLEAIPISRGTRRGKSSRIRFLTTNSCREPPRGCR